VRLEIFTIALDAMPFITWHLPIFNRLRCDWHWTIVEGAASNVNCTKWCQPQAPRLSRDGTTEYVNSLRGHPRITVIQKQNWRGKVEMCNAAIQHIKEECALVQVDADEIWYAEQLNDIVSIYETDKTVAAMQFYCRYFLGWNIVAVGDNSYGNRRGEWVRSWRFFPGNKWKSHEPPVFEGLPIPAISRDETRQLGLVFDHFAYCTPQQVSYKESFYGYPHALENWLRLQQSKEWPVKDLRKFLPWVGENAQADLLHR
jgi:hypothetical protein